MIGIKKTIHNYDYYAIIEANGFFLINDAVSIYNI